MERFSLWITSIRDSFVTLLPLTFIAVICVLIRDFPIAAYQRMMLAGFGPGWQTWLNVVIDATYGLFGMALCLIVAVGLGKRLAERQHGRVAVPSVYLALSALANFMICMAQFSPQALSALGEAASFAGFIVGIASAELLHALLRLRPIRGLRIPYDTDAAFYHALRLALPILLSSAVMLLASGLCASLLAGSLPVPAIPLTDSAALLVATLLNQLVWFVGMHGSFALDALFGNLIVVASNGAASQAGWRLLFDNFVLLGGSGATLGLLMAIHIAIKDGAIKHIGRLSWLPSIFNINETVLYGLPILLNRLFFVPFVLVPMVLACMALLAVETGWLQLGAAKMPWTTPMLISGWMLTGSWHGVAFQLIALTVSTAIYLPFVRRADSQRVERQQAAFVQATDAILGKSGNARMPVCERRDGVGLIARGLLGDFRDSLRKKALFLAYQPKHHVDGRLLGFEALLRWQHPKYGMLSPAIAVALAEESGDIQQLGAWAIEEACACKARWNQLGGHAAAVTMSINVSPLQLEDGLVVDVLKGALQRYGLSPEEIELEITESQRLTESAAVSATLEALLATGVRMSIDDFGMGYASLRYLKRFAVGAIKIDGSITRDVVSDPTCADIVRVIAALGRSRDVMVVGECVETAEQRERLAELGCQCFQGYLFSRPLPEYEATIYIEGCQPSSPDEVSSMPAHHKADVIPLKLA